MRHWVKCGIYGIKSMQMEQVGLNSNILLPQQSSLQSLKRDILCHLLRTFGCLRARLFVYTVVAAHNIQSTHRDWKQRTPQYNLVDTEFYQFHLEMPNWRPLIIIITDHSKCIIGDFIIRIRSTSKNYVHWVCHCERFIIFKFMSVSSSTNLI